MRELKFLLPFDHTSLAHAVHNRVRSDLMGQFAGYSEYAGKGNWRDPKTGKEYPEDHILYCVIAEKKHGLAFRHIAIGAAEALSQTSLVLCGFHGEWELIDLP